MSLEGDETATPKEALMEKEAVEEVVEKGSASFREWREMDQQKQDKDNDKEQEQKEKDS